jgi:hypothetical protein
MRQGAGVEVIAPSELRRAVLAQLQSAAATYVSVTANQPVTD